MAPSPRESEVLALRRQGLSLSEIAERLGISSGTVKVHVTNIRRKGLREERPNRKVSKVNYLEKLLKSAQDTVDALAVLTHHQVACLEEFRDVGATQDTVDALAVLAHHQVACLEEFRRVQADIRGSSNGLAESACPPQFGVPTS